MDGNFISIRNMMYNLSFLCVYIYTCVMLAVQTVFNSTPANIHLKLYTQTVYTEKRNDNIV